MEELIMQAVMQWLGQMNFCCLRAFETEQSFPRLENACIAAGIGDFTLLPGLHYAYLGKDSKNKSYYGQRMLVSLVFDVYSPGRTGARICDELTEDLLNALLRRETPFYCRTVTTGENEFDARLNVFHRQVRAKVCVWSCSGTVEEEET